MLPLFRAAGAPPRAFAVQPDLPAELQPLG
jgi:hypothetical protein